MSEPTYLGLDVGGTKLAAVVADEHGAILHKERRPTDSARGPDPIITDLIGMVNAVASKAGIAPQDTKGLGVSFGGLFDTRNGVSGSVPNLPGWEGVPLRRKLESAFPNVRIEIDNDANATALAEWRFGAGRGFNHVLYLTMGTGIGGGIVSDGRLIRGANDSAGEIGHTCLVPDGPPCGCGKRGCLEAFCSGPSIARRAQEKLRAGMSGGDLLDHAGVALNELRTEHLLDGAQRGNRFCLDHFRETARYMGWGIANAVSLLNPEVVVLGTVATAAGDLFLEPLREEVRRFAVDRSGQLAQILPAALGDRVGDIAAIALVFEG